MLFLTTGKHSTANNNFKIAVIQCHLKTNSQEAMQYLRQKYVDLYPQKLSR